MKQKNRVKDTRGRLFIVATPIGNLEDISARAIRVLREVALIAAEDTRHSKRLLDHYDVATPLTGYHDHNEILKTDRLLRQLEEGRDVALISDAGTPCVSDPGYRLVRAAREKGITVIPIPGPSAPITALSASGLPTDRFTFHGFFPRKRGQADTLLKTLSQQEGTHAFFESPKRLGATLARIAEAFPDAEVCVARELTKIHEELVSGSARDVAARYAGLNVKGECLILVHVAASEDRGEEWSAERIRARVEEAMQEDRLSRRDAIRRISVELGIPRNRVYDAVTEKR